ncbi:hypothetical protein TSAR_015674, partial [Trichomalopsis sarcophagae]
RVHAGSSFHSRFNAAIDPVFRGRIIRYVIRCQARFSTPVLMSPVHSSDERHEREIRSKILVHSYRLSSRRVADTFTSTFPQLIFKRRISCRH